MPAPTADQRLAELLDREEIRNLTFLYCHYVWQRDLAIVDLFAPDGVFMGNARAPETAVRGRDALVAEYTRLLADITPLPFIHNHVIEFQEADHATGWCYLDVRTTANGQRSLGVAFYNDTYVRIAGTWKFQERSVNFVQSVRLPAP